MAEKEWRPISEASETPGNWINVRVPPSEDCEMYRWLAYKKDGARQMGKAGRWQRMTHEMGGWKNEELPKNGEFRSAEA